MRVLIINYEHPPVGGGAGVSSSLLAQGLVRLGHEVCVVTSALSESRGLSVENGVRIYRIPALRKHADRSNIAQMASFAASAMIQAPGILRAERIEAMIAYFTFPSGLVARWLGALSGLPYVVSLRGGDVPGHVPELWRWHRGLSWLRRWILRSARVVVANSQSLAELSKATDPFPVEVIPSGVDTGFFRPDESRVPSNAQPEFRLLFVGRLHEHKNVALLLAEFARLRREGFSALRLHVAGDGADSRALRDLAERLGISDVVEWHGWVYRDRLTELYRSSDCFVNPSLYEGLPNAVLEAMASGLPVLASDVSGNNALVVEGETGHLFALEDSQALGEGVVRLMSDLVLARQLGAAGRDRVERCFSREAAAAAYSRLLA